MSTQNSSLYSEGLNDTPIKNKKITIMDIESLTGNKIISIRENAHFWSAMLENGVRFAIPKW